MKFWIILTGAAGLALATHGYCAVAKAPRAPQPPPHEIFAVPAPPEAGADRTLVVPDKGDQTAINEMEEDLNVMGRILTKAVNGPESKVTSAMGIAIHSRLFGAMAGPQNLYLDGYGALFVLGVSFPLLPPVARNAQAEAAEETSTEWEEAKRELYQATVPGINLSVPGILAMAGASPEEYSEDRVKDLKSSLLDALKNAVHIRGLKADEFVVLVVNGRAAKTESQVTVRREGAGLAEVEVTRRVEGQDGPEQRLILKAKRSDIEAFQKGKLTREEFGKSVSEIAL